MIEHVRRLPQIAEVERGDDCITLDTYEGVAETQVAFVFGLTELGLTPIGMAGVRIASRRSCAGYYKPSKIGANACVVSKVAEQIDRPPFPACINIQTCNGVHDA